MYTGVIVSRYTTIKVSVRDKKRLERLAKLVGAKSLSDAFRYVLSIAEKELERYGGNVDLVISSLKYAEDVGETNAEKVDEYLYGGSS